ncbi:conserved hypothetical protein [uncultured spirochete]|uniref:Uncharacterized protein n=1 Tax=uncultured spirochete TaxID=156406 RepID=A0A3P3XL38_9SPIR|nr:conserved hypothetical protein [uncultured spirochete]
MGIVSTGQITLYDYNDAAPITAFISASKGTAQVFTKDESITSYNPDYSSAANVLTAYVYVNGVNVVNNLTNRKWGTTLGGSDLGTNVSSITKSTNIDPANPVYNVYFEGDYTDPVTMLVTHVNAMITLHCVKSGTNAVFVQVNGQLVIEGNPTGGTKNTASVTADLMRAAGIDNTGVTYQWFKSPYAAADQLDANHVDVVAGKYSFKNTAGSAASAPADGTWADVKTLVVREDAVNDIGLYLVKAKDADGNIYQAYFQIYDVSDPYDVKVVATNGNVFQNGNGTKNLTPEVWYGNTKIDITNYTFTWKLYDKNGKKSGFIDTARTSAAKTISSHTTGSSAVFTISSALSSAPVAGDVIRVISADGLKIESFEVASATTTAITIRSPQNGFSNNYPASTSDYANGKLWLYVGNGATAGQKTTTGSTALSVTGDDIDGLGTVFCDAINPNV